MNFNMIILISFVFVIIPALIKRFELENKIDARIQKVLDINFIFDTAFGKIPKYQYNFYISLGLGIVFTYLSLNSDTIISSLFYLKK